MKRCLSLLGVSHRSCVPSSTEIVSLIGKSKIVGSQTKAQTPLQDERYHYHVHATQNTQVAVISVFRRDEREGEGEGRMDTPILLAPRGASGKGEEEEKEVSWVEGARRDTYFAFTEAPRPSPNTGRAF